MTQNCREYTTNWENGKHGYEEYLKSKSINQLIIQKDCTQVMCRIENFQREIYSKLYKNIIESGEKTSFEEIQRKLQEYLRFYNCKKTLEFGLNKGKTPLEVILKGKVKDNPLPLWFFIDGI